MLKHAADCSIRSQYVEGAGTETWAADYFKCSLSLGFEAATYIVSQAGHFDLNC